MVLKSAEHNLDTNVKVQKYDMYSEWHSQCQKGSRFCKIESFFNRTLHAYSNTQHPPIQSNNYMIRVMFCLHFSSAQISAVFSATTNTG